MAQLAVAIVLGISFVYGTAWRCFGAGRSADRHPARKRSRAQRSVEARAAARLDEYERLYGVTGQACTPTADEVAEVHKRLGWQD